MDIEAIPLLCEIAADFFPPFFLPPCLSLSWDISTSDRYTRRSARGSPAMPGPGQSLVRPAHSPTSSPLCMDLLSPRQRRAMERFSPTQTIYPFSINWWVTFLFLYQVIHNFCLEMQRKKEDCLLPLFEKASKLFERQAELCRWIFREIELEVVKKWHINKMFAPSWNWWQKS